MWLRPRPRTPTHATRTVSFGLARALERSAAPAAMDPKKYRRFMACSLRPAGGGAQCAIPVIAWPPVIMTDGNAFETAPDSGLEPGNRSCFRISGRRRLAWLFFDTFRLQRPLASFRPF